MADKRQIEVEIKDVFPTPVYFSNINRALTQNELDFVEQLRKNCYKNEYNYTSNETEVLLYKPMKLVNEFIEVAVSDYFRRIINPSKSNKITPVITQSWLNFTKESESHHPHAHPNSLLSGVFYFNAEKEIDNISFFQNNYDRIYIESDKHNKYNATSYSFAVNSGDLLLFPSNLHHKVNTKKGKNLRVSLAFNVFFTGNIGVKSKLTHLNVDIKK